MAKEDVILQTYNLLKDYLEDDDDFEKMHKLIEQMAGIDAQKAYDMWYPLLNRYESFVTECQPNASGYLTIDNLDVLSNAFGNKELDKRILGDKYLKELLFCKYCYAGFGIDYTKTLIERKMIDGDMSTAEELLEMIFQNKHRTDSWFETIDGFINDISWGNYEPNLAIMNMIAKYASKVSNKKEKAKIMSSLMATGKDFDYSLFENITSSSQEQLHSSLSKEKVDMSSTAVALKKLIESYPNAIDNRQQFKAFLSDYLPEDKLHCNVILMAFDEGLHTEIKNSSAINDFQFHRMIASLVNNYGMTDELAKEAVQSWAFSFNIKIN